MKTKLPTESPLASLTLPLNFLPAQWIFRSGTLLVGNSFPKTSIPYGTPLSLSNTLPLKLSPERQHYPR